MLIEHLPDLHEIVDVGSVHVNIPASTIFLCGGDISHNDDKITSLRKAFLRFAYEKPFNNYKILIAEEINAFFPRGTYEDLLSLESDLAQIASLILVFSESFGSAAELGAFAVTAEIAERLLVIIDDKNYNESSFVKLGPLKLLENSVGRSAVYVLNRESLKIESVSDVSGIDLRVLKTSMTEAIRDREASIKKTSTLNAQNHGHLIMLMVGITQQYGALTADELSYCLGGLGIEIELKDIKNFLLCAEFIDWVTLVPLGSRDYYASSLDKAAISFRRRPDASDIDMVRWRAEVTNYWKEHDSNRFSVISKVRSRA